MGSNLPSLIFSAIQQENILPVTSRCNLNCVFCSHKQNPPGIKVYRLPERKLSEIKESFKYLSGSRKIIIGESATRIIEGEPFCYAGINEILKELRLFFPETPIQITTNGTLLSKDTVKFLKKLEPLELIISLNILNMEKRREFLGDKSARRIREAVEELSAAGLSFHGSVVAMPHLLGWEELEKTLTFLKEKSAKSLRVFLPGFTGLASPSLNFDLSLWKELCSFVSRLKKSFEVPLLLEPPLLNDLAANIEGILEGTPAEETGLKAGDVIISVDGKQVRSRIEAFDLTKGKKDPPVELYRCGSNLNLILKKGKGELPGFVVYRDMDPFQMDKFFKTAQRYKNLKVLVLTSVLGFAFIRNLTEKIPGNSNLTVKAVPNNFFGGSIMSAGLLVTGDFIKVIQELQSRPDLIVIPEIPFDFKGEDLLGNSYLEIQGKTGFPVVLV
ncbi:MAG: DUF512 domain-containing protein [Firmicutes bacterium HGW-Firmicutes-13]|nr:MAG: DUF512 domain-containing protein [Firmicutes bacterium HGW-Firmicutes-13]